MNRKNRFNAVMVALLAVSLIAISFRCRTHQSTTKAATADHLSAPTGKLSIDELTKETTVVAYVKKHGNLPEYYITKQEARDKGWDAASGNLCDVLPGRAIGGDNFGNREGQLPKAANRKWKEADLNYKCGRRNADRLVFSNDGLIYVTNDHYQTFNKR